MLRFELIQQLAHIARGAAVILLAGGSRFEVLIKARHVDDADGELAVASLDLAHFLARSLGFERHFVARQEKMLLGRARRCASGQDLQMHDGVDLAADQLHDVIQSPADHVGDFAALAFANADDAVVDVQLTACRGWAAGQNVQHSHVVIDELQRSADAFVRQAHLDFVFLGIAGREIAGMRIEDMREGVHEHFEDVIARHLLGALEHALIALLQDIARLGPGLLGQHQ